MFLLPDWWVHGVRREISCLMATVHACRGQCYDWGLFQLVRSGWSRITHPNKMRSAENMNLVKDRDFLSTDFFSSVTFQDEKPGFISLKL